MRFDEVASRVADIPFMTPALGQRVYEHIIDSKPEQVLELGTAHGVGACYIAAALQQNGGGHLTTVDHGGAHYDPPPEQVIDRAGLSGLVTLVREYSSYTWWLKGEVARRSDRDGNCAPFFDFVYLDGSKNFHIDGLAVVLIEKLLNPGGWLLMDDLEWTYRQHPWHEPYGPDEHGNSRPFGPLSESERNEPHLRAVFDLVVRQHPAFTDCVVEDEWYGWARKQPGAPRRYELRTSRPIGALVAGVLRRRYRAFRSSRSS
jgi:predicted O-methyltransferase YrrM